MTSNSKFYSLIFLFVVSLTGCFSYSFTGGSIPDYVRTIYIPFFPDQTSSGQANLSSDLNRILVNRFVNQSRLRLANDQDNADVYIDGAISLYSNKPFSISSNETATQNRVEIIVRATYHYRESKAPEWSKSFTGFANYDPTNDPVNGELEAIEEAIAMIAQKMFDESVAKW